MLLLAPAWFLLIGIFLLANPWRLAEAFVKYNVRLGGKVRESMDDRVLARFLGRPFSWMGFCGLLGYGLYVMEVGRRVLGAMTLVGVVVMLVILAYGFIDLSRSRKGAR